MAKSFLKLDSRRPLRDGTFPIKIAVSHGTNLYLSTGISVSTDLWNAEAGKVIGASAKRINDTLSTLLVRVQSEVLALRESGRFHKMSNAELKAVLQSAGTLTDDTPAPVDFFDVANAFLSTKSGKRTIEIYNATLKKLHAYAGNALLLEDIKPNWLREFEVYLGGSANGRAIHLRNIRAIFNYALDEEITTSYPFRKFKIKKEETRKRSLSVEQMREFLALEDLTNAEREYRDMFLLTFYLIGINIADMASLMPGSIVNGRLEYRRAKTGKLYSIKLQPEALNIINRYAGEKHLLSPFDRYKSYRDYNHHINDALKKLGPLNGRKARNGVRKRKPIAPDCSTYWARHTWATIAYNIGIPDETIAAALGHSHGNRITAIYIDKSGAKTDEANRKVIDHVLGKDSTPAAIKR